MSFSGFSRNTRKAFCPLYFFLLCATLFLMYIVNTLTKPVNLYFRQKKKEEFVLKTQKKTRILSWLLTLVMLFTLTAAPVQAASQVKNQTKSIVMVVNQKSTIKPPVSMTYKSSNTKVVTVSSKGVMTAKAKGQATVTGTCKKAKWTYKIKVENPRLSATSLKMTAGSSKQLKLTGTSQKISWSTSSSSIVSVSSKGKLHAKKAGNATITAKVNGVKYKCRVTVKKKAQSGASQTQGEVWIPATGKKYHSRKNCSNMKSPKKVSLQKAKSMGYTPCKKCYR